MNVVHSISELPTVPSVYALYGGRGHSRYVAYVGIARNLRSRIRQHLVHHNSSITTGTSAVTLNPDYVTEVAWWLHDDFMQKQIREAAEMVAFDVLDPALRSRGAPQEKAKDLYADEVFRAKMRSLFSAEPAGRLVVRTLEDALERILALEEQVAGTTIRPPPCDRREWGD